MRIITTSSFDWSKPKNWGSLKLYRDLPDLEIGEPFVSFCEGHYFWQGINRLWIIHDIIVEEYSVLYILRLPKGNFNAHERLTQIRLFVDYVDHLEVIGVEFLGRFYRTEYYA